MGRNENNTVSGRKVCRDDVHLVACRRVGDRRLFGLRLVKQRERPSPRPTNQNYLWVAELFARMANPSAEVEKNLFHNQRAVVLWIAAGRAQNMESSVGERFGHRQQLQR